MTLTGELDLATAPRLDDALRLASRPGRLVVVDLRRVEFVDGAGAHLLIEADRRIRDDGGRMLVVRSDHRRTSFLDLLGLGGLLELCDRPPAASVAPGDARPVIEALRRQHPDAAQARLATAERRLEATTAERDELRGRVAALERELLDLVYQPPAHLDAAALLKAQPA